MENKESLKEYMLKEIEIVQDIIKRMAFNSFMIEGQTITLVVITLLLKGAEKYQVWIAFVHCQFFGSWMHTFYGRKGCIGSCMIGL